VARGRRPAHTRDQVADAAITVADTEGLAAVTMRRIAAELGAGVMSLYTYVPDKERLVDLMVDRVGGTVTVPPATGDWQADLLALLSAQHDLMLRHPWLPSALPNRQLTGTNSLTYLERGLTALAPTGLAGPAKMEVIALLTGFVASYATNEIAQSQAGVSAQDQLDERIGQLRAAVASGAFPHLAGVLADSAPDRPAVGSDFTRIAERMISGLVSAFG
jgi:AcrR family transcriptional regulator